jgi:hypothetical protein
MDVTVSVRSPYLIRECVQKAFPSPPAPSLSIPGVARLHLALTLGPLTPMVDGE